MPNNTISNPGGAYGYTALDQTADRDERTVIAASTVSKGDVVCWVTQATDTGPTVRRSTQGTDDPASVAGVALQNATVGKTFKICRDGPCLVNIGTGTVAAWERAVLLTGTPGAADGVVADATTISGDTFGTFLGGEIGTTNQAVLDFHY